MKCSLNNQEQFTKTMSPSSKNQSVGTPSSPVIPLTPVARNVLLSKPSMKATTRDRETHDVICDTTDFTPPSNSSYDSSSDELDIVLRNNRVSEWLLRCSIAGTSVAAVIDSGAVVSTMNFATYSRFKDKLVLEQTDKKIRGVGGHAVKVYSSVYVAYHW